MTAPIEGVPEQVSVPMRSNPGGARWCPDHNRLECVIPRSRGRGICHGTPFKGLDKCRMHAGVKGHVAKAQGQAVITAWNAMGGTPNIDYRMAVLGVLQMTWLRLGAYSELLRRQVAIEGDATEPDLHDPDEVQSTGLIGYRYGAAGKEGRVYAQSEEVRALVVLETAERDRVVKYAKTAHDMGISERLTSLAERWGDVVAGKITAMLADPRLQLAPHQQAVIPELISAHLGSIDVEMMETPSNGNRSGDHGSRGVRSGGGPSQ